MVEFWTVPVQIVEGDCGMNQLRPDYTVSLVKQEELTNDLLNVLSNSFKLDCLTSTCSVNTLIACAGSLLACCMLVYNTYHKATVGTRCWVYATEISFYVSSITFNLGIGRRQRGWRWMK